MAGLSPCPRVADREAIALLDDFHTRWVDRIATNNGIDPSDTMTALGLRAMIGFACEAIDQANATRHSTGGRDRADLRSVR